ncbi:MAG: hypothetical protein ACF8Q5_05365 [Phycisphaerales bacterium JB040]
MDEIRSVVNKAGSRLLLIDFLRVLVVVATVACSLILAARIAQKLFPFEIPWDASLLGAGVVTLAVSAVIAFVRRKKDLAVAREVDDRAGLRASLGTALYLGMPKDAWDTNVIDTARETARRVNVGQAVPIAAPARWPVPVALALALLAVWWLPTYDVTGLFEEQAQREQERAEIAQVKAETEELKQKVEAITRPKGLEMKKPEEPELEAGEPLDPAAPTTLEEVQRTALKELTRMEEELKSTLEGEKGAEAKAMQDAMRRLTDPGPGPASEMARAMANADFDKAQEQLEKLMDQVKNGDMTKEEKRAAADQLKQLSQQMQQMAQQQQQMTEQLQAAGFSEEQARQMAANADQMQQQLQQNQSLTDQQKQQLQQAANAQRKAADAMSSLSQSMGQMAQGMQNAQSQQGQQQMQQGGESMSGQLSSMSALKAEMAAAQQALGQCQGQMAALGESMCQGQGSGQMFGSGQPGQTGQWQQGQTMAMGNGSGGPGRGNGAGPDEIATDYLLQMEKSNVNTTDGPVIASTLVYGQQVRGESKAAFAAAVAAGRAEAAEAIDVRRVPREMEGAVQGYFGRLERTAADDSDN